MLSSKFPLLQKINLQGFLAAKTRLVSKAMTKFEVDDVVIVTQPAFSLDYTNGDVGIVTKKGHVNAGAWVKINGKDRYLYDTEMRLASKLDKALL